MHSAAKSETSQSSDLQDYKEINNPINQLIHPNLPVGRQVMVQTLAPAIAEWLLKKH